MKNILFENIKKKIKELNTNSLYYMFIFTLILNDGLGNSVIPGYDDSIVHYILLFMCCFFSLLCIFKLDFKERKNIHILIFIIVGFLCYLYGKKTGLLLTILASVLGDTINVKKLFKLIFFEKLFIFTFIITLSLLGLIPGGEVIFNLGSMTEKTITLGYQHANTFAANVGILIMLYLCLNKCNLSKFEFVFFVFITFLTYLITKGKIAVFLISILLLSTKLSINFPKYNFFNIKRLSKYLKYFFIVLVLINFLLIIMKVFFDNPLLLNIDHLIFHGRIGLAAEYLKTYSITLFGSILNLDLISSKIWYIALDNGYMINLLFYGIIGFITYLYIFQQSYLNVLNSKNMVLVFVSLCLMIWTMYEGIMISASSNFILLLFRKNINNNESTDIDVGGKII